jgi:hypothetical protein
LPDSQKQQQADQFEGKPPPDRALLPPIGYGCDPAVAQFNGYLR